ASRKARLSLFARRSMSSSRREPRQPLRQSGQHRGSRSCSRRRDPLASGLVASLARPGGNITGLSNQTAEIASKRVELLHELAGQVRRLAIIIKSDNASAASEMRTVEAAAGKFGMEVVPLEVGQAEDIGPAFDRLKGRADALYVVIDSLVTTHANRINILALGARLPTMHGARELVAAGGLMSYAANYEDLFRRGAEYIDKILRGTN